MTTRTRYFVIASLLVLGVGVGTGLVAYYAGYPMSALGRRGGPEELQYVPRDATVLAYADVRGVMGSDLRRKVHEAAPMSENGQREFQDQTGINIETDIDHVVAFVTPGDGHDSAAASGAGMKHFAGGGMVLVRGLFDPVKIEALMREHGAHIEDYGRQRLIVGEGYKGAGQDTRPDQANGGGFALAFLEQGLAAVGSASLVRSAIDNHMTGQNVTTNEDLMSRVRSLEGGNAWAVGRFDVLQKQTNLPANIASQLPPITWFSVSSHVNGGIRGTIQAETRDEPSANNLRDVVRGFMALAKLQVGSKPEYQTMMDALVLGGNGTTVTLSFAVPSEAFDLLGKAAGQHPVKPGH